MCYSCLVFRLCKENSLDEKSLMLFWLWKDAQLACKRCPLSLLLTPFKRSIEHLLLRRFTTNWLQDTCGCNKNACFSVFFKFLKRLFCNNISKFNNQSSNLQPPTSNFKLQTSNFKLQTSNFQVSNCLVSIQN